MFSTNKQTKHPFFSQKNLYECAFGVGVALFILLGFSGYDAARWYIVAKSWPTVEAGIHSREYCGRGRSSVCPYSLEYTYNDKTYFQRAELNKFEYEPRINALGRGDRSESIIVPIKINPDNPQEIAVPPQSLGQLTGAFMAAVAFLLLLFVGIYLKQRHFMSDSRTANT